MIVENQTSNLLFKHGIIPNKIPYRFNNRIINLPYYDFSGKNNIIEISIDKQKEIFIDLLNTVPKNKKLILEIGTGHSTSAIETAVNNPNSIVVSLDTNHKPSFLDQRPSNKEIPEDLNGSNIYFFSFNIKEFTELEQLKRKFDRVQIIAPIQPEALDLIPYSLNFADSTFIVTELDEPTINRMKIRLPKNIRLKINQLKKSEIEKILGTCDSSFIGDYATLVIAKRKTALFKK